MNKENMRIWDSFPKTDEKYTKAANVDGNKQTSLSGNYMVKLATSALGPIGIGWGYKVIVDRMDETKPCMINQGSATTQPVFMVIDGKTVWELNHTIMVEFWNGTKDNTFEQFGHTKYRYMKADLSKVVVDNEYAKKSLTDAMKKCLSLIGVCADVFMGEFDDQDYRQVAKLEHDIAKADNAEAEKAKKVEELKVFITDKVSAMDMCPNIDSMRKVYGLAAAKIDRESALLELDPKKTKARLDKKYFEVEAKLNPKKGVR